MSTRLETDIVIAGGGLAGLTAAAAFGAAGFGVICVDPAPAVTAPQTPGADLRTTAFLRPSRDLLEAAGVWPALAPHAAALNVMRLIDDGGPSPVTRSFDSRDLSDTPFGWNLPNWLIRRELIDRIEGLERVSFLPGAAVADALARTGEIRVRLDNATTIRAKLLIAADGRHSAIRERLGIGVKTLRYGQKALSFTVTHDVPHETVSTEIHRSGGPFTLVPLPDHEGRPASAVIWMETGPRAAELAALDPAAFEAAATERSLGLFGALKLISPVTAWPMIAQLAHKITAPRTALMAEAAHVVPPIGAQGLNMSLADIAALLAAATARPEALGGPEMLARYARARHAEMGLRVFGVDLLNRASMTRTAPLQRARAAAMGLAHDIAPLRQALMQLGMGQNPRP